ncbi:MAG: hypothetical protein ABIV25_02755 [Paracoccaceae bacterium]
MKNFLVTTALILGVAGSASAMTYNPTMLSSIAASIVQKYAPNANLTNLTVAQVNEINLVLQSSQRADDGIAARLARVLNVNL